MSRAGTAGMWIPVLPEVSWKSMPKPFSNRYLVYIRATAPAASRDGTYALAAHDA